MRFLLDHDVDVGVARPLIKAGHQVVLAHLAGLQTADDDDISVWAHDRGMVVISHDGEFAARRRERTIGKHLHLRCPQPDAVALVQARVDELVDVLDQWENVVVRVSQAGVRAFPPRWK